MTLHKKGFNLKLFNMYKRGYKVSKEFVVMHQGERITNVIWHYQLG